MSLVPYHPREGREIVLRHHNAIVVRDPASQRLEIRGLQITECPTCHQPLRSSSPERHFDNHTPNRNETYVDPDYFRMLRAGNYRRSAAQQRPPSSPIRRLVEPVPAAVSDDDITDGIHNAEFVSSVPAPQNSGRIRREAFSPNYFNSFFMEERELGRGGKGVVLLVRHEIDGCFLGEFACKRVPVGDDHAWLEKVLVEVELLAKLSHPNLVSYRHVWLEDVQITQFGPSVACAFILQQYCNGGDLLHYVVGDFPKEMTKEQLKAQMRRRSKGTIHSERPDIQRRLSPEEIYSLFKDVTSGLAYLHASNYIHRDLKPSNCLLHREGSQLNCLISDFGEVQPENAVRNSTGSTGTISYCAPEVLKKDATGRYGNFTTKSDIFSLGMILYFMCFGRLPYHFANAIHEELEDIDQLRAEITDWKGFQDERRERPDLPPKLYQLLKKLLSVNPSERPTASEVLSAMKGEAPLEGLSSMRSTSNPSIGLAGRRIQNLDSPMPPSTPGSSSLISPPTNTPKAREAPNRRADPTRQARVNSAADEEESRPTPVDGFPPTPPGQLSLLSNRANPFEQALDSTVRHRRSHNSLTLTRSTSQSPERPRRNGGAISPPLPSPTAITTPLLMAPPTTGLERVRNKAALVQYKVERWWAMNEVVLRLALLGLKLLSLSWTCWPYSASMGLIAFIFGLAAIDLVDLGRSGHVNAGSPRIGNGSFHNAIPNPEPRHWLRGWRKSLILLALHFLGLGIFGSLQFGLLCASPMAVKYGEWEPL
ncbi:kinase-like domain-containing protein [Podospora fimiseda]|uniref:non-specific serine/threonine protein kinase n=1 Tax=Podospora fimiseda TaxID=252190 RepID=A0AAN7BPZ0_9PEZI|nr:kinase-like domain-containing protein [Podospora fimiseda]